MLFFLLNWFAFIIFDLKNISYSLSYTLATTHIYIDHLVNLQYNFV